MQALSKICRFIVNFYDFTFDGRKDQFTQIISIEKIFLYLAKNVELDSINMSHARG